MTSNIRPLAGRRFSAPAERTPCQAPRPARRKYAIRQLILPALVALSFAGCGRNPYAGEIDAARTLAAERPDSALSILQGTRPDRITRRRDRAEYALLYTSLQDRCYVDVDNDSLLRHAVEYYKRTKAQDQYAKACYYQGIIHLNRGETGKALDVLLSAYHSVNTDYHILGLITCMLGDIHLEDYKIDEAIRMHGISYNAFAADSDSYENCMILLDRLLLDYQCKMDYVAADSLARLSITSAEAHQDSTRIISGYKALADNIIQCTGDYVQALKIYSDIHKNYSAEAITSDDYASLAAIHLLAGNHRTADTLISRFKADKFAQVNINRQIGILHLQADIKTRLGDFIAANAIKDSIIMLNDSLYRYRQSISVATAEERFDAQQLRNKNAILRMRHKLHLTAFFLCLTLICAGVNIYRLRLRRSYIELEQLASSYKTSNSNLLARLNTNIREERMMKELIENRLEKVKELASTYYFNGKSTNLNEKIRSLAINPQLLPELRNISDIHCNKLASRIFADMPNLTETNRNIATLIICNFSAAEISIILGIKISNVYLKKSRLKYKIQQCDFAWKSEFLNMF